MQLSKIIYLAFLLIFIYSCSKSTSKDNTIDATPIAEETASDTGTAFLDTIHPKVVAENDIVPWNTMVNNSYLIIQSTASYAEAKATAIRASKELDIKVNYRGYIFDSEDGLKESEMCTCGEIHGYSPRGKLDGNDYISIEYSNSFAEFEKGYYIVVAAAGDRADLEVLLPSVLHFYPDAYINDAKVYVGCMH